MFFFYNHLFFVIMLCKFNAFLSNTIRMALFLNLIQTRRSGINVRKCRGPYVMNMSDGAVRTMHYRLRGKAV